MSIKKYSSGSWVDIPYRKYETATDTITMLPKQIIADGQSASAVIKGAMSQSGTPTPTNPIYPTECGDKTANLFDNAYDYAYISANGDYNAPDNTTICAIVKCEPNTTYTITQIERVVPATHKWRIAVYASLPTNGAQGTLLVNDDTLNTSTITTLSDSKYIAIYYLYTNVPYQAGFMVNLGSTALPYKPYGYEIPISCGGTTTPVYLGEVQSTRQIKQLVLTGQENWGAPSGSLTHRFTLIIGESVIISEGLSSHYMFNYNSDNTYTHYYINSQGYLYIFDLDYTSVTDFKAYLAAQYAAGTPVTIWYVLATPTTGIVNEPIRKIDGYTDSVSGANIPTTGTAEQFDVDTTLKPSEVELTYHGWHEHSDTVFSSP